MKIITVFKTHVDIGFTDLPKKVLEKYFTIMLADAVETCEQTSNNSKNERFVWTLPSYPLYHALEVADEDVKNRLKILRCKRAEWKSIPMLML